MKTRLIALSFLYFLCHHLPAQMMYQYATNKRLAIASYGRIGIDWNFNQGGSLGRRLNLNNMGSIGGRMEEQDYLELAMTLNFPVGKAEDKTDIIFQGRMALFSSSLSLFGNSTSASLGGLTFSLPELFVEAKNIKGTPWTIWIGARFYRGEDVHIADHFYFNDHSGQGFGVEYKGTRFSSFIISSTDTSATLPPSFYLNVATGTPTIALRGRATFNLEQDIKINETNLITLLGEFQRLQSAESDVPDSLAFLNYPADIGWVFGVRLSSELPKLLDGSIHRLAVRFGEGIANGGEGGLSRTFITFGAPNENTQKFRGAYSFSLVDRIVLNISNRYSLQGYLIYTNSKGAASSNDLAKTFFNRDVLNRKQDFTVGVRNTHYITDIFHLLTEVNYSQRKDGTQPWFSMVKLGVTPTIVPNGIRGVWSRPHFRFVFSLARYNDFAMEKQYSPYLELVGQSRWGHYLGVKAEWWIW